MTSVYELLTKATGISPDTIKEDTKENENVMIENENTNKKNKPKPVHPEEYAQKLLDSIG